MDYKQYIKDNTLRLEASRRGGGIEIDCQPLFNIDNAKMSAYQNYLGGGLLGSIQANANFKPSKKQENKYFKLSEELKKYFFTITNEEAGEYDEWNSQTYDQNQEMPVSAY